jgi:predicted ArsR family transcriptional regulator
MSTATVRHHLRILAADNRVEVLLARAKDGKGRPEKIYGLSQAVLGDNLSVLADALLNETASSVEMEVLAKCMVGQKDMSIQPLTRRLAAAIERLNAMQYAAHWEAASGGPRVIFSHCPYSAIVARHPELCSMDEAILRFMLGRNVSRETKPDAVLPGLCPFAFLLMEK